MEDGEDGEDGGRGSAERDPTERIVRPLGGLTSIASYSYYSIAMPGAMSSV